MALSIGTRLGPYEITGPLGAGGMGEVYRARDTKLKRDIALKVLPAVVAADPDRMARFEREAEILASLNHPGIASIYGLVEGALVMELVEGETLHCPLPIDTAIAYAKQIADAIEYAHDRGVIHRDLKPANIKVTPDGAIKVLDFGLAKALDERASIAASRENSPTFTMGATAVGVILGTAAYMSPEQAVGKTADRRSDIFSFGAVLYEMLTGKCAFAGESVGDTLAAVVKDEPDWRALPAATPVNVRNLLKRALTKDRRQRLQAIGEARIALEHGEPEASTPRKAGPAKFLWPAMAAILGCALAAVAVVHFREGPRNVPMVSSTLLPPDGADLDFTTPFALPALSPDGTSIVFGAKRKTGRVQLWLRRLDSPDAHPLPRTEGASFPFWSPDSRWIGFGQANKLKKIDSEGGPPVDIAELAAPLRGASWSSRGVIVYCVNGAPNNMMRVSAGGGSPEAINFADQDGNSEGGRYPWFLPDGRHFLYTNSRYGELQVRVGSLDKPRASGKVVTQAHSNAVYTQGHLLYLHDNTLMEQPFDLDRLETTGGPVAITDGIPTFLQPSRAAGFTVSSGGLLVYQGGAATGPSKLAWKDRSGKVLSNLGEPAGRIDGIALSPDGKRLASSMQDPSGNFDIWIFDAARGMPTRLTFDPAQDRDPVWTPDGSFIYFKSDRRGPYDIFRKASNGSGADQPVVEDAFAKTPTGISADGKSLLYTRDSIRTDQDIWMLPLAAERAESRLILQTPFRESGGRSSPDGQWVAYQSDESGQMETYIAPFPGPGGKRQISSGGGKQPVWRRDGRELFYVSTQGTLMAAPIVVDKGSLEAGPVQRLFEGVVVEPRGGVTYDVSADGQRFIVVDDGNTAQRPLTLIQNCTALRREKGH